MGGNFLDPLFIPEANLGFPFLGLAIGVESYWQAGSFHCFGIITAHSVVLVVVRHEGRPEGRNRERNGPEGVSLPSFLPSFLPSVRETFKGSEKSTKSVQFQIVGPPFFSSCPFSFSRFSEEEEGGKSEVGRGIPLPSFRPTRKTNNLCQPNGVGEKREREEPTVLPSFLPSLSLPSNGIRK